VKFLYPRIRGLRNSPIRQRGATRLLPGLCCLDLDERLDDLFRGDSVVERDAELPAQWFECAQGGGDRHGDEGAGACVENVGAWPCVTEGVQRGQALEVRAVGGLTRAEFQELFQPPAEQSRGRVECGRIARIVLLGVGDGGSVGVKSTETWVVWWLDCLFLLVVLVGARGMAVDRVDPGDGRDLGK
jgi:hypothetical protein